MLERNRGARRARTRNIKQRGYRALVQDLQEDYQQRLRDGVLEPEITPAEYKRAQRRFLTNEGRAAKVRCPYCCHGLTPPDWCYAGAERKQKRLRDSLNADRATLLDEHFDEPLGDDWPSPESHEAFLAVLQQLCSTFLLDATAEMPSAKKLSK